MSDETRRRILSAAGACLERDGIRRTTMVGIAEEAGLSRAALYKYYSDKPSIVVEALARLDDAFWSSAVSRVSARRTIGAQVAEAIRFTLEQDPGALAIRLRAEEPDAFAATVGEGLRAMAPGMAAFWRPFLEAARERGEVRPDLDVERACEWIMRIVISLVTMPTDDKNHRRLIEEFLIPGLR
ncbi:MAG: TetR/AcrR family transcriptional regulator [Spirochaetaceae bacterium]|nr:TetR/AcrR family transcriptional regulator [Myxococcales bacterium]MCB9725894.1 TetR/AcrR family transcriptional regulator [Spirochaetaceae bacterium]HPG26424.1 TetR/AcrR family transcriptional regulator [Myxococcota bacterium]